MCIRDSRKTKIFTWKYIRMNPNVKFFTRWTLVIPLISNKLNLGDFQKGNCTCNQMQSLYFTDCDNLPTLYLVEPVFVPNVGICQSRQIVNIFPSDPVKPKSLPVIRCNRCILQIVIICRSFILSNWFSFQMSEFANIVKPWIIFPSDPVKPKSLPGNIFEWIQMSNSLQVERSWSP